MAARACRRLLAPLAGLTYEVRGRERIPATPAIFAFKHQSAWETLALHLLLADPAIVLKRELTQIPLFGWYLLHAGMIRIDRGGGARALRTLVEDGRAALARGSSIVVFPEGTRAPVGERNPYHPGVAALYRQLDCPVVPVALNSGLFWRPAQLHQAARPDRRRVPAADRAGARAQGLHGRARAAHRERDRRA